MTTPLSTPGGESVALAGELRAAFEAWAHDRSYDLSFWPKARTGTALYQDNDTQEAWEGYQAASAQVSALRKSHALLVEALEKLVARIELSGGIGEYTSGPAFVMQAAYEALAQAKELTNA